jgi:membrane-bound lytic murein transglycosylase A
MIKKHFKISLALLLGLIFILLLSYYKGIFGPHISLTKTTFDRLPHWGKDDTSQALVAFQKSCVEILKRNPQSSFHTLSSSHNNQAWQAICLAANKIPHPTKIIAQKFFETWFEPYTVRNNLNPYGLFTGYYLPLLHGSLKKTKEYSVPIYAVPQDLIKVNLGLFKPELAGKTLIGQLKNNTLLPYPDRAAIHNGALGKNAKVIVWIDSLVDAFFAQIQGSAVVQSPNHQKILIGYDSTNGQPYTAIGKILIANNAIPKASMSMQAIRNWLLQHPEQVKEILNQNASYVFFRALPNLDPLGTEQVPLTPKRSLAVDTHYIPIGAPIWLNTEVPGASHSQLLLPFHQMLIAQDTGGAITGIVRGDIYWGAGVDAAFSAGHMKQPGRYWILLPKAS